jgi:hypothetical protein
MIDLLTLGAVARVALAFGVIVLLWLAVVWAIV